MKKKTVKIIIICIFLALIIATAFIFGSIAIESYRYDMDPANGVDILEGFGAVIAVGIGACVIIYELDLLYTIYYFFIKHKTKTKAILNFVSHFILILVFLSGYIADFLYKHLHILREEYILTVILFWCYAFIRLIYFFILLEYSEKEI